jgi:hypothetical protein
MSQVPLPGGLNEPDPFSVYPFSVLRSRSEPDPAFNSTVGFEGLASATERPSKSLHRMLSATGNPCTKIVPDTFSPVPDTFSVGKDHEFWLMYPDRAI